MATVKKTPSVASHTFRRRRVFRRICRQKKIDAFLVTSPEDVGYLTGFSGDDSFLALGRDWACLITDPRYREQAARQCLGMDIHVRFGAMTAAVMEVLTSHRTGRLGLQAEHVTLKAYEPLVRKLGRKNIIPLYDVLSEMRIVKDDAEIRAIRRAVGIAQKAYRQLLAGQPKALIGRKERDVAAELDYRMRCLGASRPAFETIVAAGAHSSQPHYRPGGKSIRSDHVVLIDWGAEMDGYVSDLTRVICIGRIPRKLTEAYNVVLRAQAAAIRSIRPGVACKQVDAVARSVISKAGYGEQFFHGTGHGIGRRVHEAPGLGQDVPGRLRKGMVVTVEPGIYFPGLGGIRIEDDILVTSNGYQRLSRLSRTLAVK